MSNLSYDFKQEAGDPENSATFQAIKRVLFMLLKTEANVRHAAILYNFELA